MTTKTPKKDAAPVAIKVTPQTVDAVLTSIYNEKKTIQQAAELHGISQLQVREIKKQYGEE